ncbi:MAG: hypothetical protein ACAI38_18895 [Myxococcota bacterium]
MAHAPRLFADDEAVRRVGRGLLDRTLPKSEWTHEAHLGAIMWILLERPDINLDEQVRDIISGYNQATGGVNDDTTGYHDTITRCFIIGIRGHVSRRSTSPIVSQVNALLVSAEGEREWPLRFYSRELLFSVPARRAFVPPDLAPVEPTLTREHWTRVANAMAENPYAIITCPECKEGILRSRDQAIADKPGFVRRYVTCDLCGAESSMRLRAQTL